MKVRNWCDLATTLRMSGAAATSPTFQPVSEKIFPAEPILIVRSRIEELRGLRRGTVRIACSQALALDFLPRQIGEFRNVEASPEGKLLSAAEWAANRDKWLPSTSDGEFVASLMKPCWERGQYASWVSAPKTGIDGKAGDFEYVSIHRA